MRNMMGLISSSSAHEASPGGALSPLSDVRLQLVSAGGKGKIVPQQLLLPEGHM